MKRTTISLPDALAAALERRGAIPITKPGGDASEGQGTG